MWTFVEQSRYRKKGRKVAGICYSQSGLEVRIETRQFAKTRSNRFDRKGGGDQRVIDDLPEGVELLIWMNWLNSTIIMSRCPMSGLTICSVIACNINLIYGAILDHGLRFAQRDRHPVVFRIVFIMKISQCLVGEKCCQCWIRIAEIW
jgi:hypothetical protein